MLNFEISTPGLDQIVTDLAATEAQVKRALNSTLRKIAAWLRAQSIKGLSAELQIKAGIIRRRLKQLRVKPSPGGSQVTVWYGLDPVALIYLGAKRTGAGVKAGGRMVSGAFIARGGRSKQVFKRKGRARLPIAKQEAEVQTTAERYIENDLFNDREFEARFWRIFEHELGWAAR